MTNPQNLYTLIPEKIAEGKCGVPHCRNTRLKSRNVCSKHKHQRRKLNDPIGYIYDIRKQRAKERGHKWDITIDQFRKFCKQTGYHENCGKTASSMSIDRIDNSKGYSIDNIQILTLSENSSKRDKDVPF